MKDPKFFPRYIRKYFLDNRHKVITTMIAKSDYFEKKNLEELEFVKKAELSMTESEKQNIVQENSVLKKRQEFKPGLLNIARSPFY